MKSVLLAMVLVTAAATARSECLPIEAGGTGVAFGVDRVSAGYVYSWHCPIEGGYEPSSLFARPDWKPQMPPPTDPKALRAELSRLNVMNGYDREGSAFLRAERQSRLDRTLPKTPPKP